MLAIGFRLFLYGLHNPNDHLTSLGGLETYLEILRKKKTVETSRLVPGRSSRAHEHTSQPLENYKSLSNTRIMINQDASSGTHHFEEDFQSATHNPQTQRTFPGTIGPLVTEKISTRDLVFTR